MTSKSNQVGDINIERFELTNYSKSPNSTLDISEVAYEFSYYEDIRSPSIYADVTLVDGGGLMNSYPIVGDEDLTLVFSGAFNLEPNEIIDVSLRSYKVGEKKKVSDRAIQYPIFFTTNQEIENKKTEVVSGFNGRISDIIPRFSKLNFVNIEPTEGLFKYAGMGHNVFDTIRLLAKEAKSSRFNSSNYLFYQLHDGYYFVTLESLFLQDTSKKYYYTPANVNRGSGDITPDQVIDKLEHIKSNDLLKGMERGLYGNQTESLDPLRKVYNVRQFDYFGGGFNATNHIPEFPSFIQPRNDSSARNSQLANVKFFASDLNDVANIDYIRNLDITTNDYGRKRHTFSGIETSLKEQMMSNIFRIAIPGDSARHAGQIIEINMPESSQKLQDQNSFDKYLSGRFLIVTVRHMLQANKEYVTIMECVKDCLEDEIIGQ